MTTKSHKYLAYTLYDEDTVNKVMSENYIEQVNEEINLDDILEWDYIIDNNKDYDTLRKNVLKIVEKIR